MKVSHISRDYLHLPPEIVPSTLRRQARAETARPRPKGPDGPRGPPSGDSADRDAYRRGPAPGMEPKGGAGSDFRPEFVSFVKCAKNLQFYQIHMMKCAKCIEII
ncbi:ribosomal 40S subunit protein S10A [Desmophyllum pertusum]|uniref:Ribosomal 40S subunit protein S10A n=1 Tax=Desmophyllum pertusum TaxID=174260 RepID=A0A9W9Z1Z6_9CNID|nr:ribosomal 40S subunit protein S10A [Desmophyllum pertusum]